jgi:hypothetical protein
MVKNCPLDGRAFSSTSRCSCLSRRVKGKGQKAFAEKHIPRLPPRAALYFHCHSLAFHQTVMEKMSKLRLRVPTGDFKDRKKNEATI